MYTLVYETYKGVTASKAELSEFRKKNGKPTTKLSKAVRFETAEEAVKFGQGGVAERGTGNFEAETIESCKELAE